MNHWMFGQSFTLMRFCVADVPPLQQRRPAVPWNPTFTWSSTSLSRCRPRRGRPPTIQMFRCTAAARTAPPRRGGAPRCRAWANTWAAPWRTTSAASGRGPEESADQMTSAAPLARVCRSTCLALMMQWNCVASWPMRSQRRTAAPTWRILMPSESSGSSGAFSSPCLSDSLSASIWWVWADHRLCVVVVSPFWLDYCLLFSVNICTLSDLGAGLHGFVQIFPQGEFALPVFIFPFLLPVKGLQAVAAHLWSEDDLICKFFLYVCLFNKSKSTETHWSINKE